MRRAVCLLLLCACSGPTGQVEAVYLPDSGVLFDAPWPTDDRNAGQGLDLTGYVDPGTVNLLDTYLDVASGLPGWGTSAPLYVPLRNLPDDDLLPTPQTSVMPGSGLVLADIDPDSPDYGTRYPVQWELLPAGSLIPRPTLAVAPVFGFPLAGGTTYALIVTTDVVRQNQDFQDRLRQDSALDLLSAALGDLDLKASEVAVATVFTTRNPLDEMDRLVQAARALPAPDLGATALTLIEQRPFFHVYEGAVDAPLWQHGAKPYAAEGGGFVFDAQGVPRRSAWEPLRLAISTPTDVSSPPARGWPLVVYAHGTGGTYTGFADASGALEPASLLGQAGFLGLSFDQPLHGPRGTPSTDVELHSFNYVNPEAARANFRQGALDIVWLVHGLRDGTVQFTTDTGVVLPIDADRVLYVGHSHGGLTGALALPWLGHDLRGGVLSGAGGGLAISVVKRKDPFDIASLVGSLLGFGPEDRLTPLHPVVGLVQLLVEETDPINYAPCWQALDCGFSDRPAPVLLTSGSLDAQTDHETAEALAAAGRLAPIQPSWNRPAALELRGLLPLRGPVQDNATGFDGQPVTGVLSQWEGQDHFVIFNDRDAARMWQAFVQTAADGPAVVDTSP